MNLIVELGSSRAKKARFGQRIGQLGYRVLLLATVCFVAGGIFLLLKSQARAGYFSLFVALSCLVTALWYRLDLQRLHPTASPKSLDDIIDPALIARLTADLTPKAAWDLTVKDKPAIFFLNHLLIDRAVIAESLSNDPKDMPNIWQQALKLMAQLHVGELDGACLAAALLTGSGSVGGYLTQRKLDTNDITEVYAWTERLLGYIRQPKPYFGGVGRDWASGFTPMLDSFGENLSRMVEKGGGWAHHLAHADALDGIINYLDRGNGVALIGDTGVGKTELVHGLAERLLEGREDSLHYYQIVSLNASMILSSSSGSLEQLILSFFGEAVHAGNIILFLDEAQLFFGKGTGAFDLSQVLLPVLKNHQLKIIAAFTPHEWQNLQANDEALAANFSAITINEPDERETMKVVEDGALVIEQQNQLLITYEAVREAYRLSGQYMQDKAYPGKTLSLLNEAVPYTSDKIMTDKTIQETIEKTTGIKASTASAPEADVLLHLEDNIHQRMINQTQAVNAIAAALRRGRAGVSNPKRPVGSYLFLGPTGVGKTELAKSLAAVYFGDEQHMIRLDMSEFQQPTDVSRLLATGQSQDKNLLLSIREQPFSVVLLDEIEKAHPDILNLLLQLLDEGQLTDEAGRPASFRSSIIIATSNAGAADIAAKVEAGQTLENFERPLVDQLIASGQFKPELINRFDEVVLFRPLNESELAQVANLMLAGVNKTLATQKISVQLTPAALEQVVKDGYDPEFGARPMRRAIQKSVEDAVAVKILDGEAQAGSTIMLDINDLAKASELKTPGQTV